MDGIDVKKLLILNDVDLNDYDFFENTKQYNVKEIPKIMIDKQIFKQKITDKYGTEISNYIMRSLYANDEHMIDPTKIFRMKIFHKK